MGFYIDPRYVSVGPDNEWLLRGLKLGILRDGRMFKLHHSVGDVLDGNKNLICSCNNALFKPSLPNKSQERMHSTLSIDIAQREYYKWNYFWLLVGWIGVQKKFGINLICHSSGRLGRLPLYLITRTLLNLNLTLKDRARLIFGLAIESRVIYKNRRKVKYRSLAK
jgi:hypothetical protein